MRVDVVRALDGEILLVDPREQKAAALRARIEEGTFLGVTELKVLDPSTGIEKLRGLPWDHPEADPLEDLREEHARGSRELSADARPTSQDQEAGPG